MKGLFEDKKDGIVLFSGNNTLTWKVADDLSRSFVLVDSQGRSSEQNPKWDVNGSWKFDDGRYALMARETESQFNFSANGLCTGDNHQW